MQALSIRVRPDDRAGKVNSKAAYRLLARKNNGKQRGGVFRQIGGFACFRVESYVRSIVGAADHVAAAVDAFGFAEGAYRSQPVKVAASHDEAAHVASAGRATGDPAGVGDGVQPRDARDPRRAFHADDVKHAVLPGKGIVIHRAHDFQRVVHAAGKSALRNAGEVQPLKCAVTQAQKTVQLLVARQLEKAHDVAVVVDAVHERAGSAGKIDFGEVLIGQLVAVGRGAAE